MVLDVSQLIQNDGAVKELEMSFSLENMFFNGLDIVFTTPFKLKGMVKNIAGTLYLELNADVSFETQCARCLDTVSENMSFEIYEVFSKTPSENDDEVTVLESGNIDLDDVVENAFVGMLPINYVCSEDCKGLCPECGCNLNHETCSCDTDNIDPRLAVLKNFLKD